MCSLSVSFIFFFFFFNDTATTEIYTLSLHVALPISPARGLLLLELVDEIDEVEEPTPGAGADHGGCDGNTQMSLPAARAADEDSVALGIQEGAGRQLAHLSLIHGRVGEDEAVEILQHWELGAADPVADRSRLTMGALGTDQAGNERIDLVAPGQSLARDLVEAGAHAVELELAHRVENLMAFH